MKNFKNTLLCLGLFIIVNSAAWPIDVYTSWFTDAASDEFTAYGYDSDTIGRPTAFPTSIESNSYGTRGKGADISTSVNFSSATFAVDSLTYMALNGGISFWICPREDGELSSGGGEHYILRGGSSDLSNDGFRISWDNRPGYGLISFTMAGRKTFSGNLKLTSCQYDISGWTAGEWHHVMAAWVMRSNLGSTSKALVLFIDRKEVVSVVFGGEYFMNYSNTDVTIGGGAAHDSSCYIDELIFRKSVTPDWGDNYTVRKIAYRDFFLTAPYTSIQVTYKPFGASDPYAASPGAVRSLPADPWILLNKRKQFGVIGTRKLNAAGTEQVTEYLTCSEDDPNSEWMEWSGYDAKPVITWEIYDPNNGASLVNVNVNGNMIPTGLVQGDVGGTQPYITATFRKLASIGCQISYFQSSVRTWEDGNAKPDLGIMHVSREIRYDRNGIQQWPAPGETIYFTVYFGNFGTANVAANSYHIKFEYATDTNNNFRVDDDEIWAPICPEIVETPAVDAGDFYDKTDYTQLKKTISWQWPYSAQDPTGLNSASQWIRVTLDSAGQLTEICEANNTRTEKTNARAFRMGYHKQSDPTRPEYFLDIGVSDDYDNKLINLVGSFSDFDWYYSHLERVNIMLQTTKSPTVSAVGIQDGLRMDDFYAWNWDDTVPFPHEPGQGDAMDFDGSYCDIRIKNDILPVVAEWRYMSLYSGECHELGHNVLRLPDLYGYKYSAYNVLSGVTPGSAEFPITGGNTNTQGNSEGMSSSHDTGNADAFKVGNAPLMSQCQLWMHPTLAGFIHHKRQDRAWESVWGDNFKWGDWTPQGAGKNRIQFLDYTGNPLTNAGVYVYPIIHHNLIGNLNKYFPNQVKFTGTTDSPNGIFIFPFITSNNWDDWNTIQVEGAEICTSPFNRYSDGDYNSTDVSKPSCYDAESLLIKVVGGDPASTTPVESTEYHLLPLTELNRAYFTAGSDSSIAATYTIRTSLKDYSLFNITVPDAPVTNNKPHAELSGPTAPVYRYSYFTLSANGSDDGDSGRTDPLWYWWVIRNINKPDILYCYQTSGTENTLTTSLSTPGIYTCTLYVLDGLKMSDEVSLDILVVQSHQEHQAEDGSWNDGEVETEHMGYTGTGYVNTENDAGNYIEWEVTIPIDSTGSLIFRYANGSSTNREMTLTVNGDTVTNHLNFVTTNAWTSWSESGTMSVPLDSGTYYIRITANTDEGAPNVDRMDIYYYYN